MKRRKNYIIDVNLIIITTTATMDYLNDLYHKVFDDFFIQFDAEYDLNYTCNVFLSKNMTLIEIDRGWEGIPESLVIQLILCLVCILNRVFN